MEDDGTLLVPYRHNDERRVDTDHIIIRTKPMFAAQ